MHVSGRECGDCSLCCKLLVVVELGKPGGVWCDHADPGKGCGAYQERPQSCRVFACAWLRGELPDYWAPRRSRMVIGFREDDSGKVMEISVDRGCRNYEREPWKADIEKFSRDERFRTEVILRGNGKS